MVRKYNPTISTLAIGDGANDVSMITAAHVGVGIKGVEGQQASRASDYAVGEFKMLKGLVLVHGRESYRKNSDLVLYNFFKNIVLVFPQFWMSIYNNFSGQTPYDAYIYQLYNVFFTSMPIIIYSVFDQEYSREQLYKNEHKQYSIGLNGERFSTQLFWGWFMNGTFQSACIAFTLIYVLEDSFPYSDGFNGTFWWTGTAVFGMTVVVSNNKIALMSNNWSIAEIFFYVGSMLMYLIILIVVMLIPTSNLYDIVSM